MAAYVATCWATMRSPPFRWPKLHASSIDASRARLLGNGAKPPMVPRAAEGEAGGKPQNEYSIVDARLARIVSRKLIEVHGTIEDYDDLDSTPKEEEVVAGVDPLS
ncbi:hypothetical protein [Aureimonas sp. AU4]|uniref:hypothetical protein n=1 Tax=Aureimonas sp. AU4 TaxID=1638163 RepID=UPI0012E3532F|nr:hypothetical protein [Aureimonas sp. AU4]